MFFAGASNLEANKEWINELNVFPVPDGDTGTNMTLTIRSAVKEVGALEEFNMTTLCKAISSGSLRGARGNSGVILSQLMRGFSKEVRGCDTIDKAVLAAAATRAVETAYKAVMKPKEGTILTVARGIEQEAVKLADGPDNIEEFMRKIILAGDEALQKTPELLPVLKEAGVVDSGGQGLMQFMKGALEGYLGKEVVFEDPESAQLNAEAKAVAAARNEQIKYVYCTEFYLKPAKPDGSQALDDLKTFFEAIGDSRVVVKDGEFIKAHVHTNDPGLAIQKALTYGGLVHIKVDNMKEEHREFLHHVPDFANCGEGADHDAKPAQPDPVPPKAVGFITVSMGEGLSDIFKSLNVDEVIEGGQTMNPSTDDILCAIERLNAETIFILPNNKNIILAAEQAKALTENKTVYVIPSKTIPQGITALINYSPSRSNEENARMMTEEMGRVKTGEVTYAVRDTSIEGKAIAKDDIMGISDKGLLAVGSDIAKVACSMAEEMVGEEDELISIYYGKDVSEEDAGKLADMIRESCPDCEVEVNYGGQPIYYYVISAE
jgi:DAK2 domain fusion protein YloV